MYGLVAVVTDQVAHNADVIGLDPGAGFESVNHLTRTDVDAHVMGLAWARPIENEITGLGRGHLVCVRASSTLVLPPLRTSTPYASEYTHRVKPEQSTPTVEDAGHGRIKPV
jgi:hypothetical protein